MPVIRLKSVVLPAPFGPITLTISPSSTPRSRSDTTASPPNESETPRSSSSGASATSDDLHSPLAQQAVRPQDHQRDQDQAEHDEAHRRDRGGRPDHHVLPDERGQIER